VPVRPGIAGFFSTIKTLGKYQDALQDFGEYKKVWKQFAYEIEKYDNDQGQSKHGKIKEQGKAKARKRITKARRTRWAQAEAQVVRFSSQVVDQALGGGGAGGPGDRVRDRVPQAFLNQLQELQEMVMFAAKTEHKASDERKEEGCEQPAARTRRARGWRFQPV